MGILVTGGAGFIGSCIVRELNNIGISDIVIVDNIRDTEKWKNLRNKQYTEYINRDEFMQHMSEYNYSFSHVIHMGACSATTETNFDYLYKNNFDFTRRLWNYCIEHNASFIYASSAATYGDGKFGFDDKTSIQPLEPLNGYGYSKQLFDLWAEKQVIKPIQHVGFKFFNVYGPNEYYKGTMASVILHSYRNIKSNGKIDLFKSYKPDYANGEQQRDFVYVKDICKVILFMMNHKEISGLFNLGTGKSESFNVLASSIFSALTFKSNIQYIEMPEKLKAKYQYYTEACIDKLRQVGYSEPFYSLKDGIDDYVKNYLENDFATY